jgi:hypothetical protein
VSSIVALSCGSRLYGGTTGVFGSCSVWKLCARAMNANGPWLYEIAPSRGSVDCDVTAMRSARSAK